MFGFSATMPSASSPAQGAAAASPFGIFKPIDATEVGEAAAASTVLRTVDLPRFTGEDARDTDPLDPGPSIRETR